MNKLNPNNEIEILKQNRFNRVVGIDEVGRGCWAGPVYVGAYVFSIDSPILDGVNDSKKLSIKKREALYSELLQHEFELGIAEPNEIDKLGITKTIEKLISELIENFRTEETLFLIDGQFSRDFGVNTSKEVKGDLKFYSIACASILAKVARDELMNEMGKEYVYYGFEHNKGYGTKKHIEALKNFGVCDLHRKSYKPIKKLLI